MGMELTQSKDFSAIAPREKFAGELQRMPTSPALWASRQRLLSMGEIRSCHCKLGELCVPASASRPDICVRPAQLASKVNSLLVCAIHGTNDLIKTIKE